MFFDVWFDINSKCVYHTRDKAGGSHGVPEVLGRKLKGKKSFGGEMMRFLDLALGWLANLISILEEIVGLTVGDEEKFPLLSAWTQDFADAPIIKGNWPH